MASYLRRLNILIAFPILLLTGIGNAWDKNEFTIWPMVSTNTFSAVFISTSSTSWSLWPNQKNTLPYAIATSTTNSNIEGQFIISAYDIPTPDNTEMEVGLWVAQSSSPYSSVWQVWSDSVTLFIDKIIPAGPSQFSLQ